MPCSPWHDYDTFHDDHAMIMSYFIIIMANTSWNSHDNVAWHSEYETSYSYHELGIQQLIIRFKDPIITSELPLPALTNENFAQKIIWLKYGSANWTPSEELKSLIWCHYAEFPKYITRFNLIKKRKELEQFKLLQNILFIWEINFENKTWKFSSS